MIVVSNTSEAVQKLCAVSIVVPVYNQEKNVSASLERIKRVIESTGLSHEIIVVNDGSSDSTMSVLRREVIGDSKIRVVSYSQNMGKGHAVKMGITNSCGDIVVFTD